MNNLVDEVCNFEDGEGERGASRNLHPQYEFLLDKSFSGKLGTKP